MTALIKSTTLEISNKIFYNELDIVEASRHKLECGVRFADSFFLKLQQGETYTIRNVDEKYNLGISIYSFMMSSESCGTAHYSCKKSCR